MMKVLMEFRILSTLRANRTLVTGFVAAVVLATAFLLPGTTTGALLAWVATCLIVDLFFQSKKLVRDVFVFGVLLHLMGMSWLVGTVERFGEFPYVVSLLIFALYALSAALQFVFCAWGFTAFQKYGRLSRPWALAFAWYWTDRLMPKLFPWTLSHTQIPFKSFAMAAETVGVYPLSWLMVLLSAAFVDHLSNRSRAARLRLVVAVLLFALCLAYGKQRAAVVSAAESAAPELSVALVQGNLSLHQKGEAFYFDANLNRYRELSTQALGIGAQLLFWPESVVTVWAPDDIKSVKGAKFDPLPEHQAPLIYGALSYRRVAPQSPGENPPPLKFNSAFAVDTEGAVHGVYHKRVLMPFGEYMPFADRFAWIQKLSPQTADFAFGDQLAPLPLKVGYKTVQAGTLICYEDLIPSLSVDSAMRGANLLVNLTNDAWYGVTSAPYQHHLLAAWRAIETSRYFLRVTNTGLTAVVDPFGNTTSRLPIFEEGVLVANVRLMSALSRYVQFSTFIIPIMFIITLLSMLLAHLRR